MARFDSKRSASQEIAPAAGEQRHPDWYGGGSERRVFPGVRQVLHPGNSLVWLFRLVESWIYSREYHRILAAVPFLIMATGGFGLLWWLRHATDQPVLDNFEKAFDQATRDGNIDRQENYLRGLAKLRPRDPQYRFRLGKFLVDHNRPGGLTQLLDLVPDTTDGYAPARMWLVEQAQRPEPAIPLTEAQIEGQLQRILRQRPDDTETHRLLAEIYLRKNETKLAEQHLELAATGRPELNLALARLKKSLNRSPEELQQILQKADKELFERLSANRGDVRVRIALAEVRLQLGETEDARQLLVSGLEQQSDPLLRRALSELEVLQAEKRLSESLLNRDVSTAMTLKALTVDPSNPLVIQQLVRLHALGAAVPAEQVAAARDFWQGQVDADPAKEVPRVFLGHLLSVTGNDVEAAELLRPIIGSRPELRFMLTRLLISGGKADEASTLLNELLQETRTQLDENPANVAAAEQYAQLLLLGSRASEAREFLQHASLTGGGRIPSDASLRRLYCRVCLSVYDSLVPPAAELTPELLSSGNQDSAVLLELLDDAIEAQPMNAQAIDRLARLVFSGHAVAAEAYERIQKLRLTGDPGGQILNLLGMHALQAADYTKARTWLELANNQTRGRNPMILNNLAVALLRGEPRDPKRALETVELALNLIPDHPDMLSTRGEVYAAMERWQDAAADLQRALPLRPGSREIHLLLDRVFTALNDPGMALEHRRAAERLGGT